jgi:hypothetical protein
MKAQTLIWAARPVVVLRDDGDWLLVRYTSLGLKVVRMIRRSETREA